MNEAKLIKKHAAQHDLFNRLHSIAADERFVRKVADEWFGGRFEVIANQRCGTWYCDPSTSSSTYAYFKSTDGHTLNWDFNLRRSNLSLAKHAEKKGGFLLVDSTRRGKRMPDGLSKTVPIWCVVINRALALRRAREGLSAGEEWDTELYLPAIVSPSERSQIEARVDCWAASLESSVLPLPDLTRPLRPFFLHPATTQPPAIEVHAPYTPIICVSASRWVDDSGRGDAIPTATRVGGGVFARTVAFDYVPGAGDDDELWGRGLKPSVYHAHKDDLLSTARGELPNQVDELVAEAKLALGVGKMSLDSSASPSNLSSASTNVSPLLSLDIGAPISPSQIQSAGSSTIVIRVVELDKPRKDDTPPILPITPDSSAVVFAVASARTHGKEFVAALNELEDFVDDHDGATIILSPGTAAELEAALARHADPEHAAETPILSSRARLSQLDLQAARKTILPIAVALLASADDGAGGVVDKEAIARHLHELVAQWPDGNPPRAALKRVNEFLMSPARG